MVGINGQVAGLIHFRRSDRLEAASALRRLRSKRNLRVGIISEQSHSSLASLTTSLGADFQIGGLSPDDRIRFLQNCRNRGFKVAYVGDCHIDPRSDGRSTCRHFSGRTVKRITWIMILRRSACFSLELPSWPNFGTSRASIGAGFGSPMVMH